MPLDSPDGSTLGGMWGEVLLLYGRVLCCGCRCYTDFANHRQMVLSADGLVNLINYTLFIAELMLAHKVCT